jgi:hypothetical protein
MRLTIAAFAALTATSVAALAAGSADDVLKANKAATGGTTWDTKAAISIDADYAGNGLTGTTHSVNDLKNGRTVGVFKVGPAQGANGFDGKTPWQRDTSGTITEQQGGDALVLAINDAYRNANLWWQPDHGGATVISKGEVTNSTGRFDVLTVTPKGGKPFEAWFDTGTHFLAKIIELQGPQTVITTFSDYASEDGVKLPHKILIDTGAGAQYVQTMKVNKVTFLSTQPDSAFAIPTTVVTDFSIAGGAASTTIPVQIINNHIFGEAKVNGKGPFVFIFDTGGHDILTPPIAKQLGIKVEGKLPGTGAGEGVMEGGFANGLEFSVGAATVKNQLAIVFPLDKLSDIEGVPMPGMVGYETFRRFVTRIDYGASTLTLIDPAKFDPKDSGTPVKFVFNDHIPEVTGTIEGIPAKFDIDTGARSELTITKPFAETNKLRETHTKGVEAVEGWGIGGPSTGYVTRIKDMTIGDVKIGLVVGSLATQDKGAFAGADYSGNVGGGVLKRFVVTFDYNNRVMYLKPLPGPVEDTGTYDRAGLWINVAGTGFKIVAVTKGAPAEQAGLAKDDLITAVDGVAASQLKLRDVRGKLRTAKPGTVVTFTVNHGGAAKDVKVTLRDLI